MTWVPPFEINDTVVDKNGNVCIIYSIEVDRAMKIVYKLQTTDEQGNPILFLADATQIAKVKGEQQ